MLTLLLERNWLSLLQLRLYVNLVDVQQTLSVIRDLYKKYVKNICTDIKDFS